KNNFAINFFSDEKKITKADSESLSWIEGTNDNTYMRGQLNLGVGEKLYGLGERFTPFVKNGQSVDICNKDGGTSSEQSYKNIPLYLSNKGFRVFVNHRKVVNFELDSCTVTKSHYSVEGESLDYHTIYGPTPSEVIKRYTILTGKPSLPPVWCFGLWLS